MGKINYLILGAIALIFVGCSNPTPKCSDKETPDLVASIQPFKRTRANGI